MKDKVLIIGLGLMGGSIAARLREKGCFVGGMDADSEAIRIGLEKGLIDESVNISSIREYPMVIFALYPEAEAAFIKENASFFQKGALVTDVIGVKVPYVEKNKETLEERGVRYISIHPMAGSEKKGAAYARPNLLEGANFIICPVGEQKEEIEEAKELSLLLGAGRVSVISPKEHDAMIAFLSQLPHAIAVALMASCENPRDLSKYTGDSFRDVTRIASINEKMWSELFLNNKEALVETMERYLDKMEKLKEAIVSGDREAIEEMMILSAKHRKEF